MFQSLEILFIATSSVMGAVDCGLTIKAGGFYMLNETARRWNAGMIEGLV
jgi:hypothetical protein